jgi:hypothetical protein
MRAQALDDLNREFDDDYQAMLSGKGVRTDEEELALLNALIRHAEQGSFPQDGAMHIISPTAEVDWSSDAAMRAVQAPPTRNYGPLAGAFLIGLALLFALFSLAGGGKGQPLPASATTTVLADDVVSGTLSAMTTQTAVAQATAVWAGSGIVVGTDYKQKLPPVYPETLEIDGVPFRVYPSAMEGGKWEYQTLEGTASWIGGTVINWSFGVPASDLNLALFRRLEPSQSEGEDKEALLRMSGGAVRYFRLQRSTQIERQQIEVFAQNKPGLTVVLLGDQQGAGRWLLRGMEDYARSGYGPDPSSPPDRAPMEISPSPTTPRQPNPISDPGGR